MQETGSNQEVPKVKADEMSALQMKSRRDPEWPYSIMFISHKLKPI